MLIGHHCGRDVSLTPMDAVRAIERLSTALAFVGITDFWDASICLFHRKFGGSPSTFELHNVRSTLIWEGQNTTSTPTPRSATATNVRLSASEVATAVRSGATLDPFDTVVFQAALQIFMQQCEMHNVPVPPAAALNVVSMSAMCTQHPEHAVFCSKQVQTALGRLDGTRT